MTPEQKGAALTKLVVDLIDVVNNHKQHIAQLEEQLADLSKRQTESLKYLLEAIKEVRAMKNGYNNCVDGVSDLLRRATEAEPDDWWKDGNSPPWETDNDD